MSQQRLTTGKKAWDLYFEKQLFDPRLVRSEVAESWKRCRGLALNPFESTSSGLSDRALLEDRIYQKQHLCRIARPFLQDLYYFFKGSQFQVILTDEEGLILETLGDDSILALTRRVCLYPGNSWSEASRGTNAIGTALVERRPVEIYGWEHYCQANHFLTCSAAPILDAEGNVMGAVDLSGDSRDANPHTTAMVVAVAKAIENQLRYEFAKHKLYVASKYSDALVQSVSDALVTVDQHGIVTDMNPRAGEIFGLNPILARGRTLEQLCGGTPPILRVLAKGGRCENEEMMIERAGKKVRTTASPMHDESGALLGAVAILRESNSQPSTRRATFIHLRHCGFDDILGESPAMLAAKHWARLASAGTSTVLILGESGTGKELFAKAIHNASIRSQGPFVAINCAAFPEGLIESELFGYSDGSFTGARKGGQAGKFELAESGTIFLDEIGDMPLAVQAKVLRVIQERSVTRLGSVQEIPVDIRIVAATHRNLQAEVKKGTFREDLYYRLAVLEIHVPPLRERLGDLPALATALIEKIALKMHKAPLQVEQSFLSQLCTYRWPGNVRELENVIERAIVSLGESTILRDSPLQLLGQRLNCADFDPAAPYFAEAAEPQVRTLRDVERDAIAAALNACGGNILKSAAKLGIGRNTLYRKMEEYNLVPEPARRF